MPLRLFPQFIRLPVEIQNIIWDYSLAVPQTHTISICEEGAFLTRIPSIPLQTVCKASRVLMRSMLQYFTTMPCKQIVRKADHQYYNPSLDTILIGNLDGNRLRDLVNFNFDIRSMGIAFDELRTQEGQVFYESDIRVFICYVR